MLDTMTLTKAVGSLCGALLILLMGKWAGELLYHGGGGHDDDHGQAYVIDTGAEEDTGGGDEGPSLAELWAAADVEKGSKVFGKCKACHKVEQGENATGPYLYGVVGRDVSSAAGFGYSGALKPVVDVWTVETLDAFLENPKGYTPGTSMGFAGLKKAEDRVNVIAYLDQLDGDLTEMAAPATAEEAPAAEEEAAEEAPAAEEEAAAEEPAGSEETAAAEVAAEEPEVVEVEPTPEAEAAAEEATETAAEETAPAEEAATEDAATEDNAATEEAAAEPEAEEAASDAASGFVALVAAADVAEGEKVFKKCKACHVLDEGVNRVGPSLYNVVGADIAAVEGFKYSDALTGLDGTWTADELNGFLTKPRDYAPGTRMSFPGIKDEADRAAVIAYMQSVGR